VPSYSAWNRVYQSLLSRKAISEEDSLQKDILLMEFIGQFKEACSLEACKLIDEFHHPSSSFDNHDMSFIKDGIIYQLACDYKGG
jgi:hypothetical protein